jgi:glutathione synthase/RimK-type ligase-like ATP-grasp enzyme
VPYVSYSIPEAAQMILIVSDKADIQIYTVIHFLRKWRIPWALLNVVDYPQSLQCSASIQQGGIRYRFRSPGNAEIDFADVAAVWYRKPDRPAPPANMDPSTRNYARKECREALEGLYNALDRALWVNPLHNMRRGENKPLQLQLATECGFQIPDSVITNDPGEAWEFYKQHDGDVIYKSLSGGYILDSEAGAPTIRQEIYTTHLDGMDRHQFEAVANCACLFQGYVPKLCDLRVTVVGDRTFATEIHSQGILEAKHDWRRGDVSDMPHRAHVLPGDLTQQCRLLVARLGLRYAAIDMILTPAGEYVFLEINPNGQYGWIEELTRQPISEAVASLLASAPRH